MKECLHCMTLYPAERETCPMCGEGSHRMLEAPAPPPPPPPLESALNDLAAALRDNGAGLADEVDRTAETIPPPPPDEATEVEFPPDALVHNPDSDPPPEAA